MTTLSWHSADFTLTFPIPSQRGAPRGLQEEVPEPGSMELQEGQREEEHVHEHVPIGVFSLLRMTMFMLFMF